MNKTPKTRKQKTGIWLLAAGTTPFIAISILTLGTDWAQNNNTHLYQKLEHTFITAIKTSPIWATGSLLVATTGLALIITSSHQTTKPK